MMSRIAVSGALLVASTLGAPAQTEKTPAKTLPASGDKNSFQSANSRQEEEVAERLSRAGFENIRIQSESFLARAQDSDGNAVLLVINPDVSTAINEPVPKGRQPLRRAPHRFLTGSAFARPAIALAGHSHTSRSPISTADPQLV